MIKLSEAKQKFHHILDQEYGLNEAESIFYLTTQHYLDMDKLFISLNPNLVLNNDQYNQIETVLNKLKQGEPIQYIVGETYFYGLNLIVNNSVLIPRPETEELVDCIIKEASKNRDLNVLDIGTGSGCIAIALSKNLNNVNVYGIDVSKKALKVAKKNAKLNGVEVQFIEADIINYNNELHDLQFDIIVSNPPYVRTSEKDQLKANVLQHEPHLALFVHDNDPLEFYKAIIEFSELYLNDNGQLYFEINENLGDKIKKLLEVSGYNQVEVQKDFSGKDRIARGVKKLI